MKPKNEKLKMVAIGGVFIIIIIGLAYVMFVPSAVKVEVAKVSVGPFQEVIRADGVLRSKDRYTVTAFADGDIKRVPLKVGDVVKKNSRITELFWDVKYESVKAPIDGVISKIYRDSAGPIRRGEPVVEVIDPAKLEVMAELLTTDAVRLRVGNDVAVENWAGGKALEAKIIRISKAGFTKQSALGVEEERTEVTADLQNPPSELFDNVGSTFHVDLIFKVRETSNALKVPVGALFRDGSSWAVYINQDGRARKTDVVIEGLGAQEASIKSGLKEGQLVLVYPGDLVKDGSRIQPMVVNK